MSESPYIEQEIVRSLQDGLKEVITKKLGEYGSPLNKLMESVIDSRQDELRGILNSALDDAIKPKEFRKDLGAAFNHKLARVLLNKFKGEIEKKANELRSSPEFRARLTLAIEAVVKDLSK